MNNYELWFTKQDNKDFKVLSFTVNDERFHDYFIDTLMSNLEYDINDLADELEMNIDDLSGFTIVKVEKEENNE